MICDREPRKPGLWGRVFAVAVGRTHRRVGVSRPSSATCPTAHVQDTHAPALLDTPRRRPRLGVCPMTLPCGRAAGGAPCACRVARRGDVLQHGPCGGPACWSGAPGGHPGQRPLWCRQSACGGTRPFPRLVGARNAAAVLGTEGQVPAEVDVRLPLPQRGTQAWAESTRPHSSCVWDARHQQAASSSLHNARH